MKFRGKKKQNQRRGEEEEEQRKKKKKNQLDVVDCTILQPGELGFSLSGEGEVNTMDVGFLGGNSDIGTRLTIQELSFVHSRS